MTPQQQRHPSRQEANDRQPKRPHKDLDLYQEAVNPSLTEGFLDENNLGLGNLTEGEVYQQIKSYRAGMFAEAALSGLLEARRIKETKRELALNGCEYVLEDQAGKNAEHFDFSGWTDDEEDDLDRELEADQVDDRRRYLETKGDLIWEELPDTVRWQAVIDHTGAPEWEPPHYRMLLARNEASKSKDARTQDNLFGRVKKRIMSENSNGRKGAKSKLQNLAGNGSERR